MVWNSLNQVVKWSSKLIGESQLNPASLYTRQVQRVVSSILNDCLHPLHIEFQLLPSGKGFQFQGLKPSVLRTVLFQLQSR